MSTGATRRAKRLGTRVFPPGTGAFMSNEFIPHDYTIIVVDNSHRDRLAIETLLRRIGYQLRVYDTAEDVIEDLDGPLSAACVISEMALPGMSGLDLTHELRERQIEVPVIILTTHSDVATAVTAMRSSVADYLMKPYVDRDLVNRLRAVISRHFAGLDS